MQRPRTAGHPLLFPAVRRAAAALVIVCAAVTVLLGVLLAGHRQPGRVDSWVDGELEARLGGHPHVTDAIYLGDPRWVVPICAVAVLACLLARRFRAALLVAIAVPLAGALTDYLLKPLVDRTIDGALVYPSGHTTAATAMVVAAVLVLTGPGRPALPAAARWLLSAAALALIPATAAGLIIAHYHVFTDTIGGAGVGIVVALGTALTLDAAATWLGARATGEPGEPGEPGEREPAGSEPAGRGGVAPAAGELPRA